MLQESHFPNLRSINRTSSSVDGLEGQQTKPTHEALQNAPQARCTFLFVLLQVIFSFNEVNECYL